jgi:quercetin dioxygenase-like cupin family protein
MKYLELNVINSCSLPSATCYKTCKKEIKERLEVHIRKSLESKWSDGNLSSEGLGEVLATMANTFALELSCLTQHDPMQTERHKVILFESSDATVSLLTWESNHWTEWHDHNSLSMALHILEGQCREERYEEGVVKEYLHETGKTVVCHPAVPHRLGGACGVTLHAYTPSLKKMKTFVLNDGRLEPRMSSTPTIDKRLSVVSANDTWDTKSSVRSKPMPNLLMEDVEAGKGFFSYALAPIAKHPRIVEMGTVVQKKVLALYLLASTSFTDSIEDMIVLPVSTAIASGGYVLTFSESLQVDARRCMVDEAHHGLFTKRIEIQVTHVSGVGFPYQKSPLFLRRLRRKIRQMPAKYRPLAVLCFCICSETLITGTLATLHKDPAVVQGIRDMYLDHAQDEARHSSLFAGVLEAILPQLDNEAKQALIPLFPEFIRWFIEPDLDYFAAGLRSLNLGLRPMEIQQILHESYPVATVEQIVWEAARPSVKILQGKGVLDDSRIKDIFQQNGLI